MLPSHHSIEVYRPDGKPIRLRPPGQSVTVSTLEFSNLDSSDSTVSNAVSAQSPRSSIYRYSPSASTPGVNTTPPSDRAGSIRPSCLTPELRYSVRSSGPLPGQ